MMEKKCQERGMNLIENNDRHPILRCDKMRKTSNALFVLSLCFILLYPLRTFAKINSITDNDNYIIPSDYAFTPKFIKSVTKIQTSDSYLKKGNGSQITVYRTEGYSNYWAIYQNVGIWRHHIVDMKITLDDVIDTNPSTKCTASGFADFEDEDVIPIYFYPGELAIRVDTNCRSAGTTGIFRIEFFDHQTGEELSELKSVLTYDDIDSQEQIAFDNYHTTNQFYYTPYGVEHLDLLSDKLHDRYTLFKGNNKWTCRSSGLYGDVNCFIKPSVVEEGSCYHNDCEWCYKAGMITVLNDGSFQLGWAGYYTSFSSTGFLRIGDPGPMKFVDKQLVKPGEEINYTIEQYVPNQATKHYYKTWKITDKLDEVLETNVDNITIRSDGDLDVTNMFDITLENNIITVSAKNEILVSDSLYNRTIIIDIKTKVKSDIKSQKEVINQAVLNIEYQDGKISDDILSNQVSTTIEVEETMVEVPNTSKFTNWMMYIVGVVFIISGIFLIWNIKKRKID